MILLLLNEVHKLPLVFNWESARISVLNHSANTTKHLIPKRYSDDSPRSWHGYYMTEPTIGEGELRHKPVPFILPVAFRFRQILVYRLGCRTISQFIPSTSYISPLCSLTFSLQFREAVAYVNIGLSAHYIVFPPSDSIEQTTYSYNLLLKKTSAHLPSQSRLLHVRRLGWRIEVLLPLRQCRRMQGLNSVDPRKKKGEIYRRVSRKACILIQGVHDVLQAL